MNKLLTKLSAITEELGALEKSGTNAHFKYKYVKAEDSMKEFRTLEVKHKIKVLPVVRENSLTVTPHGDGVLSTFIVDYNIMDIESPDSLRVSIPVQGYDSNDKSIYKALSGGFKYFLLQTFSFSSDDPEGDVNTDSPVKSFRKGVAAVTKSEMKTDLPKIMEGEPSNLLDKKVDEKTGATSSRFQVKVTTNSINGNGETITTPLDATGIPVTSATTVGKVRFSQSGFSSSFKENK